MQIFADILVGVGAIGAMTYCLVLARRLKRFNQLENGMGGAIAVLSAQVDDMTRALNRAQATAGASAKELGILTERAEKGAQRLELMLAALHEDTGSSANERRHRVLRRRIRHQDDPEDLEAAE